LIEGGRITVCKLPQQSKQCSSIIESELGSTILVKFEQYWKQWLPIEIIEFERKTLRKEEQWEKQ
jgi:hypothetical protein